MNMKINNNIKKKIKIICFLIVMFLILFSIKANASVTGYANINVSTTKANVGDVITVDVATKKNNTVSITSFEPDVTSGISVIKGKAVISKSYGQIPLPVGASFESEGAGKLQFKKTAKGTQTITLSLEIILATVDPNTGGFTQITQDPSNPGNSLKGQQNINGTYTITIEDKEENKPKPDPKPGNNETPSTPEENTVPKVEGVKPFSGKYIAKDVLNVRPNNSTDYKPIGVIAQGQEVEVTGKIDPWAEISYKGKKGYVLFEFLEKKPKEKTPEEIEKEKREKEEEEKRRKKQEEEEKQNIADKKEQLKALKEKFTKIPEVGNTKRRTIKRVLPYTLPLMIPAVFLTYTNVKGVYKRKDENN